MVTSSQPSSDDARQRMVAQLRDAGFKLTPQRLAIVGQLAGDLSHPTAQELFDRLQSQVPSMSFATVYNTLSALVDAGLCASRELTPGPKRFDPNTEPHDHAVCDSCGLVLDVALPRGASDGSPEGFELRAIERIYRGFCGRCASC